MKKLIALLVALSLSASLVACGGSDDSEASTSEDTATVSEPAEVSEVEAEPEEEVVEEEVEAEVEEVVEEATIEVYDLSIGLADTAWVDDDGNILFFYADGTMMLANAEGEFAGEYLFELTSEEVFYLSIYFNDFDTQTTNEIYNADDNGLYMYDIENGTETYMTPYVVESEAPAEALTATDVSADLFETAWVDDESVQYYFHSDNSLELYLPDGSTTYGTYLFEAFEGVYYLSFNVPDLGAEIVGEVTAMDETGIVFYDANSGTQTTLLFVG